VEIKKYPLKSSLISYIGLFLLIFLLSGCTAVVPSTNESQITQVISNFFQGNQRYQSRKSFELYHPTVQPLI
jgi:hypothetical protein